MTPDFIARHKRMLNGKPVVFISMLFMAASCGIESYTYISPVSNVTTTMNSNAVIRLPGTPDVITLDFIAGAPPKMTVANQTKTLGVEYEIFYRIYLSDKMEMTVNTDAIRTTVNPTLAADWKAFEPYTVDSNNYSSSVSSLMTTKKYYSLSTDSSGNMLRSNGNGAFTPKPVNRMFMTSDDIISKDNLTDNINADVQDKTDMASGATRYAYTSMYIVMRDINVQTLNPIYSSPTFINIFLLPSNVPVISVTGVALALDPSSAAGKPAVKLNASVTPGNATNAGVSWLLDNNTAASMRILDNNMAIIYSLGASANVKVTVTTNDGGFTDVYNVALSGTAVTKITLDPSTLTLSAGGTGDIISNVEPTNASKSVKWTSSSDSIATVDQNGKVSAKTAGNVIITATTTDGTELSASCAVTVQ
ncbi:MAG: Ig-like domain-containing protein [Treponema sp.]|jgi:hypothetical protein|nr:Ig-like domain-containing protein [Treponema sp.]